MCIYYIPNNKQFYLTKIFNLRKNKNLSNWISFKNFTIQD